MDRLIDYVAGPLPWTQPAREITFPGLKLLRVKRESLKLRRDNGEYITLDGLSRWPFVTVETAVGPISAVCELIECLQRGHYNIAIQDVTRGKDKDLLVFRYRFKEVEDNEFIWLA